MSGPSVVGYDHVHVPPAPGTTVPTVAVKVTASLSASAKVPLFDATVPSATVTEPTAAAIVGFWLGGGTVVANVASSLRVVPFAFTALSVVIGRQRILMRAMSGWYVLWIVSSLLFVALAVAGAGGVKTFQAWLTPSWLLGWLISYVWAVELRRRELRG